MVGFTVLLLGLSFCLEFESSQTTQNKSTEKRFCIKKKIIELTFNPGLVLQQVNLTRACDPMETSTSSTSTSEKHVTLMSFKFEPTIWSDDTGKQILCLTGVN